MATNTPVWGIDIGQCALKALRLQLDAQGRVHAVAFDYVEHPKILSQPDADPDELVRDALRQFLSRNDIEGERVAVSVPAQQGLARFIQLPPVEQKKIPEIVRYEARQQIPFALDEVIWDYQVLGAGSQEGGFALDTEVGLFAMKRDQIDRQLAPLLEAGLDVELVQMSPLALYNFFVYDQLELDPGAAADPERGSVVILDMGADHTDLVITNGARIWQRNIPLGGNHFTRALSKELKLTFAKAEHLKRNAMKAPDSRRVFQAMKPVFADFATEVQRSIGYFASVHRDSKLEKLVGVGNGFKLPGLEKYLQQNLQQPVEKLASYGRLSGKGVLEGPAFRENRLSFPPCYGLALQGLGLTRIHTTLLPPEIVKARVIRRKKPWAAAVAAGLLLCMTVSAFGSWRPWNAAHEDRFRGVDQQAEQVNTAYGQVRSSLDRAKSSFSAEREQGERLVANVENRLRWLELLRAVERSLPRDEGARPERLEEREQINIVEVSAERVGDLSQWYQWVIQHPGAYERFSERDQQSMPQGEGWVVTLLGHHYHDGGTPEERRIEYVQKTLLHNLQQLQAVDAQGQPIPVGLLGISHATIVAENFDPEYAVAAPGPAGRRVTDQGVGTDELVEQMEAAARGGHPGGPENRARSGREAGADEETAYVPRTDFRIQFVWRETTEKQRNEIVATLVNDMRAAQSLPPDQLAEQGISGDDVVDLAEWVAVLDSDEWTEAEREQLALQAASWWWRRQQEYPADWNTTTGLEVAEAPEPEAVEAREQRAGSGRSGGTFGGFGATRSTPSGGGHGGAASGGFGGGSSGFAPLGSHGQ